MALVDECVRLGDALRDVALTSTLTLDLGADEWVGLADAFRRAGVPLEPYRATSFVWFDATCGGLEVTARHTPAEGTRLADLPAGSERVWPEGVA